MGDRETRLAVFYNQARVLAVGLTLTPRPNLQPTCCHACKTRWSPFLAVPKWPGTRGEYPRDLGRRKHKQRQKANKIILFKIKL